MTSDNNLCKQHSGFKARIENCERDNEIQWKEINSMKKWLIATLTSSIFSLLGIIAMLLKLKGGS